jgi:DNA sulfur modification protein DndB
MSKLPKVQLPPGELSDRGSLQLNENDDYQFPCVQGMQGGDWYWMSSLTFPQIQRLLKGFLERPKPDSSKPLSLEQRTLDPNRGKKISKYILKGLSPGGFYILPPLLITIDTPDIAFDSIELDGRFIDNLGILRVPSGTTFFIPDGQHRAWAAVQALLEAPGLVQQETIGVMFVGAVGSARNKQIFLDANQGMKPSRSIMALFKQDEISDIARSVLVDVPIFAGRTALEATNIPARSGDLFTMNALQDATKTLLAEYEGDDKDLVAIRFWHAMAKCHPVWAMVDGCEDLAALRQSTIAFNAITLNALARVGLPRLGLSLKERYAWMKKLQDIDWSINNPDWAGCIKFNGRLVKNHATTQALATYIYNKTEDFYGYS